jgi:hypothetical protein
VNRWLQQLLDHLARDAKSLAGIDEAELHDLHEQQTPVRTEAVHEPVPVETLSGPQHEMHHVAAVIALALHDVGLRPDHLLRCRQAYGHAEDPSFDGMLEPLVIHGRLSVAAGEDEIHERVVLVDLAEPVRELQLRLVAGARHCLLEPGVVAPAHEHVEVLRFARDPCVPVVRVRTSNEERQPLGVEQLERGSIELELCRIDLRDFSTALELEET